ncbi:MAG TPA: class I SAM-dependent methyltransferase [Aequorivita sp.]|nr:class I SAM-dependent methyltransferase [Aequorivita sp.]
MKKEKNNWFASWFNTPYYHLLYKDRDHDEAAFFMKRLTEYLNLNEDDKILDLACGRGRHARYLNRIGFDVVGIDLSIENIAYAKEFEREGLHFNVHDMRIPYPEKFEAIFNLFTSFGYFESKVDNLKTIKSIKKGLKPNGHAVIDFLNAKLAIKNLVPKEMKKVGNIEFHIEKYVEDGFIFKNIRFKDMGKDFLFTERVMALELQDFKEYFKDAEVNLVNSFGDYHLNDFDENKSERLILHFSR